MKADATPARIFTLAWGRDYDDVEPAKGILIGGKRHWLEVSVDVVPVEAS